jgi:hypothetical protein
MLLHVAGDKPRLGCYKCLMDKDFGRLTHRPRRAIPDRRVHDGSRGRAALKGHKYAVGQTVQYIGGIFGRSRSSGSFKIIKLLPSDGDDFQYRIKSMDEPYERVAKESQLDHDR